MDYRGEAVVGTFNGNAVEVLARLLPRIEGGQLLERAIEIEQLDVAGRLPTVNPGERDARPRR